jgi:hypothetical protein
MVTWKGWGRAVGAQRDRLAVEDQLAAGSDRAASTTSGTGR